MFEPPCWLRNRLQYRQILNDCRKAVHGYHPKTHQNKSLYGSQAEQIFCGGTHWYESKDEQNKNKNDDFISKTNGNTKIFKLNF